MPLGTLPKSNLFGTRSAEAAKKRLYGPNVYGPLASGSGQLARTQDEFTVARESGDTNAQMAIMNKARSQAVTNEAMRLAEERKANQDAEAFVNPQMPAAPPQGQFFQKRRMR